MNEKGFISLYRKFLDWEWYTNENVMRLFIHCLIKANYKDKKWQGIVIERGSFITSRESLSKELKLTEQQIRTALNNLKSTNDITIKTTNRYTQIYVVNYSKYQLDTNEVNQQNNQLVNQQITNKQPTDNQQITTTNNSNNINKDNKVINKDKDIGSLNEPQKSVSTKKQIETIINDFTNDEDIKESINQFLEMRKITKAPMTPRGMKLLLNTLIGLSTIKEEQIEILNNSIVNNWKSVYPLKNKANKQVQQTESSNPFMNLFSKGGFIDGN